MLDSMVDQKRTGNVNLLALVSAKMIALLYVMERVVRSVRNIALFSAPPLFRDCSINEFDGITSYRGAMHNYKIFDIWRCKIKWDFFPIAIMFEIRHYCENSRL
ncbi:hypothetical protein TNIN_466681 [Trichonephila inaurata madagascariensis]|uniref:Uncharacterized protein n=1 Tax=Trichonephila inaurata madagascariensis TaxID=2747483 RepID=A0A8X7CFA0_9ARAC|nr:hypothetical protein TNIN_466681 [Trichonephila inaurata madagascariensis]